ncbi:MAG: hypothetical protein ALECFALPRED_007266 [Alectoria fallacina]|uniref:Uncharacterized protein n=1 Tax=Alectoria fallacina TaxID=1903189 RepID=A0A8H3IXX2_9LECA|nr:MAG: hypothetical protein ALECFALPRED_007266 [Alectoria fallacina]
MDETFTLLPIQMDPTSKSLSSPTPTLSADLTALNALHRAILSLPNQVPPPPTNINPKRSAQIQKMRDQGNTSLRTSKSSSPSAAQAQEAIKLYTYGIEMALGRPSWEQSAMVKEEAGVLFANRAQAYMVAQMWPEGASDAETSVELKRQGNGKAWWRRGRCLCEMGRWEEARRWVQSGLEVEGNEQDLSGLSKEIVVHMEKSDR